MTILTISLKEHFLLAVKDTKESANVSSEVVAYLANLLEESAVTATFFDSSGNIPLIGKNLMENQLNYDFASLKNSADFSLLYCSLFIEHLERRKLSKEFVMTQGLNSYQFLANKSSLKVFNKIAQDYFRCLNILEEVNYKSKLLTLNELEIYNLWVSRKFCPLLNRILLQKGLIFDKIKPIS